MAAQDAELKLKVSLDLAFFRQQLAGLGQATAGTPLPVQIKFDRRSVQNELNALGANIRRRNYRLNIETNLSAEIAKADTLARKLSELSGKIKPAAVSGASSGRRAIADIEEVLRGGLTGKAFGIQQAQENIARQAILSRLEKKSLSGGGYNVKGLEKIIRDLGGTPTGSRTDLVAQAKKLVEEADGISDAVFNNLKDLQMKLRPIRGQAQTSAARSMPNLNEMLDRMANLTSNPRAAQRMLRMLPESRISTDLVGAANRQAAFQQQFPQGFTLPGFNAPKAFDPLLKAIAKDFTDYARTVNISDPWVGQIGNGIANVIAKAASSPQATRLLPSIGGTASPLNTLEARLASSRGMLGTGGGVAGSLFTGRGLVNPGVSMLEPVGISGNYRQMAAALANQAANPALAHRQIADIGFGGVPTSATGLSGQALNAALNQAFLQRRGLGTGGAQSMPIFGTGGVAVQQNIPGMAYQMGGGGIGGSMGRFPISGMMGPSTPLTINAQSSMFGGGGGMQPPGGGGGFGGFGGAGGFGRALGGLGNLPGAGTIRELGSEFGFATKQVLLFGQAYKLLAFIQDFPGQVAGAVSQLQSFRNTLLSVTGSAGAAADANEFILAAVEKYSIPLQSARDGFTKLFASMEPAGFAAGEIQNLFLGITKAAATYGLSADKVDRVNYAFAQMASKGQVMSEELKGQLGDVLPGAMGIFAEAAGFKGPDAIQKFGKALEDGVYKGGKMRELLRNVADGMNKEFGPGAEGAAKTFQGAINRMQTATTKLYESFEPAAIGVLNTVAVPLVDTLKNLTDGVNAYFAGQQAATPAAQGFADALKTLVPTLSGIGENLKYVFQQVSILVQGFGAVALQASKLLALPIVRYLAGTYVQVLLLTTAFRALAASGIGAAVVAIVQFIGRGIVFGQVMLGMRVATQQTTFAMFQFGNTLQTVMIKSVIGVALVAIGSLISRLVELQNAMASVSGQSKAMGDAAKASAKLGDVAGVKEAIGNMEDRIQTYQKVKNELNKVISKDGAGSSFYREVSAGLAKDLMSLGLVVENSMRKTGAGYKVKIGDLRDAYNLATKNVSEFNKEINNSQGLVAKAEQQQRKLKEQGPIGLDMAGGDSKGAAKALEDARKLADDKAKYEADMAKKSNLQALELDEMAFEHWKTLQDEKYNILIAGENSWLSQAIKFQKELQNVEISRIETVRKARAATAKAEIEAGAKSYIAGASGGSGGGALFGSTGRVSNAPGWVHGHFQNMNREALVSDTVDVVMKLLSQGVSPELGSGAKFSGGMNQEQITNLVRKGIASHKQYGSGIGAIDVFVPEGTKVPVPLAGVGNLGGAAGVTGTLPGGTQLMHLDPSSRGIDGAASATTGGMPASRVRAELKKDYAAALTAQDALNAKERENLAVKYKMAETQARIGALIKQQVAEISPVEEQKLENMLIGQKISLLSSGVFGERLDTEQKIAEATAKATLGIELAKSKIQENIGLAKEQGWTNEQLTSENKKQFDYISQQEKALGDYITLLRERLALEQGSAEAALKGQIQRATPLGGMGLSAGFIGPAAEKYVEAIGRGSSEEDASRFAELQNQLTLLEARNEAIKQSIYGIGNAFGETMTTGVAGLIAGTASAKEVFTSFLQSVGQALSQAASQMIATYIAIGIAKLFAGLGGGGGADMSKSGITEGTLAPMRQYADAAGNMAPNFAGFANGGIAKGGFRAFANGGVVSGPTLGLVGEGRYNEAVVPLPNGRAIPVQVNGERSARDLMGRNVPGMAQAAPLTLKFESTKINGVEYVSREQLELAMAETRRASIAGGATRGMNMALDKIQQSPSTRSRIGIR